MRARSVAAVDAELLASAVALRWSRPDLTAAVAEHVAATWAADNRTWVAAAGWLVHGRAAVGDGRECASDTLAELLSRDPALLDDPAADRLRIEVASLAAAQREPAVARQLVEPLGHDRPAEVRADVLAVLARCAYEDRPGAVGEATRRATDAWAAVRGSDAEIAVASLTLLSAAAARRAGHPHEAVDHAAEGLARLDDLRTGASAPHLAAALAAERITALVEAGRPEEALAACEATARHLMSTARPTRQVALLRLTVARALAESTAQGAFEALEQAASDASACDTPDLEGLCLSTLGALREQAGRLDAALESMRRGVAAQRRDRARSERFRAALRALPLLPSGSAAPAATVGPQGSLVPPQAARPQPRRGADRVGEPHPLAANPWMTGQWTTDANPPAGGRRRAAAPTAADGASGAPPRPQADGSGDAGHEGATAFDPLFGPLEKGEDHVAVDGGVPAAQGTEAASPPVPASPVARPSTYDRDGWLAAALAELDRAWGAPLPELGRRAEPAPSSTADAAMAGGSAGDAGGDRSLDEDAVSPWASWVDEPELVVESAEQPDDVEPVDEGVRGTRGTADRSRPSVVGCVVVVDVVCAGEPVPEGATLLGWLVRRLADRIPSGARQRLDEGEAALSVVMPGQERTVAASWMHRTLPAVFHDAAASNFRDLLPVGSALRATVHDTDGPVGAQLLQRLDVARRARDAAPPVPVRWGVPIAPGSGGRRRRPDADAKVAVDASVAPRARARHRGEPDELLAPAPEGLTDGGPGPTRPEAGNGTRAAAAHSAPSAKARDLPSGTRGRTPVGERGALPSIVASLLRGADSNGPGSVTATPGGPRPPAASDGRAVASGERRGAPRRPAADDSPGEALRARSRPDAPAVAFGQLPDLPRREAAADRGLEAPAEPGGTARRDAASPGRRATSAGRSERPRRDVASDVPVKTPGGAHRRSRRDAADDGSGAKPGVPRRLAASGGFTEAPPEEGGDRRGHLADDGPAVASDVLLGGLRSDVAAGVSPEALGERRGEARRGSAANGLGETSGEVLGGPRRDAVATGLRETSGEVRGLSLRGVVGGGPGEAPGDVRGLPRRDAVGDGFGEAPGEVRGLAGPGSAADGLGETPGEVPGGSRRGVVGDGLGEAASEVRGLPRRDAVGDGLGLTSGEVRGLPRPGVLGDGLGDAPREVPGGPRRDAVGDGFGDAPGELRGGPRSAAAEHAAHPTAHDAEPPVEGLGLADLLAGALAAYRAI